jgi:hypothetical protein
MIFDPFMQLGKDLFVKLTVARYAVQVFVKPKLTKYFTLINYKELASFVG